MNSVTKIIMKMIEGFLEQINSLPPRERAKVLMFYICMVSLTFAIVACYYIQSSLLHT